jgi:hypothetical protein
VRESPRAATVTALAALVATGLAAWIVRARPSAVVPRVMAVPGE